jgi:NSS family neurotransmitter:Na+ symporter
MVEERKIWKSRSAFILASVGAAIGLGNLWRFPYVCYENGGGAFLIPYFVAMITCGIPMLILEFGVGHRMRCSAPFAFKKINKRLEWLGWWAILVAFFITIYYVVIIAWSLCYMIHSLTLAWGENTEAFFIHSFLERTLNPGILGGIRLPIVCALLIIWVCIFFILYKGIGVVGKVVYITVTLPWILLAILAIRGLTLPGAIEGIEYYLKPNFGAMTNFKVWLAAYGQIFFTLSLASGCMITYAGHLPKKSDVVNNATIATLADSGTAFFAGFAVFSVLGYMAMKVGVDVPEVVESSLALAFITYPKAISLMPAGPIFGVLFFACLFFLGIDSAFAWTEGVIDGLKDKWKWSQMKATAIVCALGFFVGLIYTTGAGYYWLKMVDESMASFGMILVGLTECIVVVYIFGADKIKGYIKSKKWRSAFFSGGDKFREQVNVTSEIRAGRWWNIFIGWLMPAVLVATVIITLIERIKIPYEGYPQWSLSIGMWGLPIFIIIFSFLLMKLKFKK